MGPEVCSLARLKSLVFGLGLLLFAFSLLSFLVSEVYLYSVVAGSRLDILQRTQGYRTNAIRSCIAIRGMQLVGNASDSASKRTMAQARTNLQAYAQSMAQIHTLNYVDPPTKALLSFLVATNRQKLIPMPGTGSYVKRSISFWDLGNGFTSAVLSASLIGITELRDPDFLVDAMGVNKRAVVYV